MDGREPPSTSSATFLTETYPSAASNRPSHEKATVLLVPIFHAFIADDPAACHHLEVYAAAPAL